MNRRFRKLASLASSVAVSTAMIMNACGSDPKKTVARHDYDAAGAGGSDNQPSQAGGGADDDAVGASAGAAAGGASAGGAAGAPGGGNACPAPTGNSIRHTQETLTADATWSGVHVIGPSFSVHGAVLTLAPCAIVKVEASQDFNFSEDAALRAIGEPDRPVTFTSAKRTPAAGDWGRIKLWNDAGNDNALEHVIVEFAQTGLDIDPGVTADVSDVVVQHTTASAIVIGEGAVLPRFEQVRVDDVQSCLTIGPNQVGGIGSFTCGVAMDRTINVFIGKVQNDATWHNFDVPYRLTDGNNTVAALLSVEAGTEVQLDPGKSLSIADGGALRALGTAKEHVVFRSSKPAPAAGDWQGLWFYDSGSASSLLRWTDIRHATNAVFMVSATLPVENVDFSQSACGVGINFSGGGVTEVAGSNNDLGAACP